MPSPAAATNGESERFQQMLAECREAAGPLMDAVEQNEVRLIAAFVYPDERTQQQEIARKGAITNTLAYVIGQSGILTEYGHDNSPKMQQQIAGWLQWEKASQSGPAAAGVPRLTGDALANIDNVSKTILGEREISGADKVTEATLAMCVSTLGQDLTRRVRENAIRVGALIAVEGPDVLSEELHRERTGVEREIAAHIKASGVTAIYDLGDPDKTSAEFADKVIFNEGIYGLALANTYRSSGKPGVKDLDAAELARKVIAEEAVNRLGIKQDPGGRGDL